MPFDQISISYWQRICNTQINQLLCQPKLKPSSKKSLNGLKNLNIVDKNVK